MERKTNGILRSYWDFLSSSGVQCTIPKTHGKLPQCMVLGGKTNVTVHFSEEQTNFYPRTVNMTLNKQQLAGLGVVNCSMNHI